MKLYSYDHCPFCTRVRMIFGIRNLPLDNQYLPSDDDATPIGLIGQKMLPILVKDDGSAMSESLDIVHYIDALSNDEHLNPNIRPEITAWLEKVDGYQRFLVWPRCVKIGLDEFSSPAATAYFVAKKSALIGDFDRHLADSATHINTLNQDLSSLAARVLSADGANGRVGEEDILLFPLLRNLSMVKGVCWPQTLLDYLHAISARSGVPLFFARAI